MFANCNLAKKINDCDVNGVFFFHFSTIILWVYRIWQCWFIARLKMLPTYRKTSMCSMSIRKEWKGMEGTLLEFRFGKPSFSFPPPLPFFSSFMGGYLWRKINIIMKAATYLSVYNTCGKGSDIFLRLNTSNRLKSSNLRWIKCVTLTCGSNNSQGEGCGFLKEFPMFF